MTTEPSTDEDLERLKKWDDPLVNACIDRLEAAETPCGMSISRLVCKCLPCQIWRKAAGK